MIKSRNYFNIEKKITAKKNIFDKIKPVNYSIKEGEIETGKDVKICIIDSGCPVHKDIKLNNTEKISFCDENSCVNDKYGHSTIVSGIIKANNKNSIIGVAYNSILLYAKVVNDVGECSFNSVVAAVLWAIVKKVDIIMIAIGTQYDYHILHDSIRKARRNNICIISAAEIGDNTEITYPSKYNQVFSVGSLKKGNNKNIIEKIDNYIPNRGLYTTYLNNKYIRITGASIATAYYTGLTAKLIEKYKKTIPKHEIVSLVYSKLKRKIK